MTDHPNTPQPSFEPASGAGANPYAPPLAPIDVPAETREDVIAMPPKVLSAIRGAWIAALVSAGLTLVFTLIAAASGSPGLTGAGIYGLIDVVLVSGLAFGIYRKSRVCATIMLLYFVYSKWAMMKGPLGFSSPFPVITAAIFLWFYARGVWGTFRYHQIKQG